MLDFKQKSLIHQAMDEKLKETIKKENILKKLEEIKKELTKEYL